jgi:FtsP/CotA-like multicopper oxidase with cupredoxin domain
LEDKFNLGPGQRVDLLIASKNLTKIEFYEISGKKSLSAFKLNVNQNSTNKVLKKQINFSSFGKILSYKNPKILKIHMQGGAMGNLVKAKFEGVEKNFRTLAMEDKKFWAFNKEVGKYEHALANIKKGQVIILDIWNDTRWPHSMHLHGNHFYVQSKEFENLETPILRDTYVMQPGEKSKFTYLADNPGKWLFHCHMLEHAASGMIGYIKVV